MKLEVHELTETGIKTTEKLTVDPAVFGLEFNEGLVHQVVVGVERKLRAGTRQTLNRSAARGGGKKPWRQKGTGRARAGTRRSPIWVGGGHTFAREPYDYNKGTKINKKMYRKAINCLLSKHIADQTLRVVDTFPIDKPRTKDFIAYANAMGLTHGACITEELSLELHLASRNIPNVYCIDFEDIEPLLLSNVDQLLISKQALLAYQEAYSNE